MTEPKTTEWLEKKLGQATDELVTADERIEALEAALRTIRLQNVEPYCREIARAALDKEARQ